MTPFVFFILWISVLSFASLVLIIVIYFYKKKK